MSKIEKLDEYWFVWYSVSTDWDVFWKSWKLLKPSYDINWYQRISISYNGWRKNIWIHRVVAIAFLWLDFNDRKLVVCHKNDIRDDNRLENLFIWTMQENTQDMRDKWRGSPFWYKYWENAWNAKLTDKDVAEIKNLLLDWVEWYKIAKKYWVVNANISSIRKWHTRSHIYVQWRERLREYKKWTIDKEKCITMYKEWQWPKDIARAMWVATRTVQRFLKKNYEWYKWFIPKLSKEKLLEIKDRINNSESDKSIAALYDVNRTTISRIRKWVIYKRLGFVETKKKIIKTAWSREVAIRDKERWKAANIDKVISLYREWLTPTQISKKIWRSWNSVQRIWRVLKKHLGDEYIVVWNKKVNDNMNDAINILLLKWYTCWDIAIRFHLSLETIRKISSKI